MGSSQRWPWQTRTNESIPLRPSTGSIATSTRICAVIWIIVPLPAMHEADLPNRVRRSPSIEYAACFQSWTRTRSRTLPPPQDAPQSVRQMPAWLPSFALPELPRAASSVPYSPAAKAEQPDADRQFHCGLPKRLRKLGPMRLSASKLIQLALQVHDWLGDRGCAFVLQYQPSSAAD